MMKNCKFFDIGTSGKLNPHYIAGMSPMLAVTNGFREGVRGIEDQKIGSTDKIQKGVIFKMSFVGMLTISRIYQHGFLVFNTVTKRNTWMILLK